MSRSQHSPVLDSLADNFNDDSLLDEANSRSFDLKNELFELRSKCNALDYENKKLVISYENTIKELKGKYAIVERLLAEKNEKEQKHPNEHSSTALAKKCQYLAEENETLRKELNNLYDRNRITPNFNSPEFAQEVDALGELLQKEETINRLEQQLKQVKDGEYEQLKGKLQGAEREVARLKEVSARWEVEKEEAVEMVSRQIEEHYNNVVKSKERIIEEMKNEQLSLVMQLEEARRQKMPSDGGQSNKMYLAQLQERDSRLAECEERARQLQIQNNSLKNENSKLTQTNSFLQADKRDTNQKRLQMQEEYYKLEAEVSAARAANFNEKLENKKQINSLKFELEEERTRIKGILDEKAQQNKRLRDNLLLVNDQNDELRQKQQTNRRQIDSLQAERTSLRQQLADMQNQISARRNNRQQIAESQRNDLQNQVKSLQAEIKSKNAEITDKNSKLETAMDQAETDRNKLQLLKFQKTQYIQRQKRKQAQLKQVQQKNSQHLKTIQQLQNTIKYLKQDNQTLELAVDQLKNKVETMETVMEGVERMNDQLKREKQLVEEGRRQQQRIMKEQERERARQRERERQRERQRDRQRLEEMHSTERRRPNVQPIDFGRQISPKSNTTIKSNQIQQQLQQLTNRNYQLQSSLSEAQNEIARKTMDLNMKEQQLSRLKQQIYRPKEMNLNPIVQANKKSQFNAIYLQNKMLQMQREISNIRSMKEKELQQHKKALRKQLQEKYLHEIKRLNAYIQELERNAQLLAEKLTHQTAARRSLQGKLEVIDKLEKENYSVKYQYSQTLEELNQILQKYGKLEEEHKQLQNIAKQMQLRYRQMESQCKLLQLNNHQEDNQQVKARFEHLQRSYEEKSRHLENANDQIRKLNTILMAKESELKHSQAKQSQNSSFASVPRSDKLLPHRDQPDSEKSSQGEQLRRWMQRSPNFTQS